MRIPTLDSFEVCLGCLFVLFSRFATWSPTNYASFVTLKQSSTWEDGRYLRIPGFTSAGHISL